ncbi:thiamine phosphate synthase [Nocardioides sp. SYSU D00065]|uniref:thiamine phosphate synthase n=1 Tax=Nocardioides sp. SYSU D00065 TaxID=2817378 RepID=UPI001B31C194|nr:thiamine phosphate synthase [Nocardioides sp. SYSU D00065]
MLPRLLCLVSEDHDLALLPALAEAGVDAFEVRAKASTDREALRLVEQVLDAARPRGAAVIVNDRVDLALAAGADGVHLGADDLPATVARRLAPDLLLGVTCRDRAQVEAAAAAGADYAGFGPVYATTSKDGLPDPLGPGAVSHAAGVLPLIAIGGVSAATARGLRDAGAHGVAVIGAIWQPPDPVSAAKELAAALA